MKTKYLFYSLAMAGMFAACSQEELIESPVSENNLATRPVAGVVEFTTGEIESRYNYEWNNYQIGDVFGLYLMDNYVPTKKEDAHAWEHLNANTTYWKYQNHWFGMYNFTNNIQSNYPFRYVKENGANVWKNDAKLVEGNYFAMYPQNEKALNRRELWHAIKPSVELKPVADKTLNPNGNMFQFVENQLWLGYKQIYRDATASAEGVMKMNVDMKAVLVPLKFTLNNLSDCDVTLDKIVIKDLDGRALPTLAYIEPKAYTDRQLSDADKLTHQVVAGWVVADKSKNEWNSCGTSYKAYGLYDAAKTWTKQTVQHLVDWTIPGEKGYPYGLDAADKTEAYEYSFAFPKNVVIKGDKKGGDVVKVFVAIPAEEQVNFEKLAVMIYGWEHKSTGDTYGYLVPNVSTSVDKNNYSFELAKYLQWSEIANESPDYRNVTVEFDDFSWKPASNAILAASTEDMEKNVMSVLAKATTEPVQITISPDVTGVEVKASFLEDLKKYSAKNTRQIEITFDGGRGGKVKFYDDNTMIDKVVTTEVGDYVDFNYTKGIKLYNYAEQTLVDGAKIENGATIYNEGTGKLNVIYGSIGAGTIEGTINNDGEVIVAEGGHVGIIYNNYKLTLKCEADVDQITNNYDAEVIVDAARAYHPSTVVVDKFENLGSHPCSTCVSRPTLSVKSGKLQVGVLTNGSSSVGAVLNIAAGAEMNIVTSATNYSHYDGNVQKVEFVNRGTVSGKLLGNGGILDNYGVISAPIENKATVNAWAGKINDLMNTDQNGTLNALSENIEVIMNANSKGKIIYTGVIAQNVQKINASDVAIFRTIEDMEIIDLIEKMTVTGSKKLYIGDNLNLAYDQTDKKLVKVVESFRDNFVQAVVVEDNVNLTGSLSESYSAFRNAELSVNDNCTMYVKGMITVAVKGLSFNDTNIYTTPKYTGAVWVGDGATLNIDGTTFTNQKITADNVAGVQGGTSNAGANTSSAMN